MRQKLLASAALGLGVALATPAAADITVTGTVIYDKDVQVTEDLTKTKTVIITVDITNRDLTNAAESNAVNNQRIGGCGGTASPTSACSGYNPNSHSYVTGEIPTRTGRLVLGMAAVDYAALTDTSVIGNLGVTQYNQDVGVGVNQANMISAAVAETASFIEANNSAAQYNFNNSVTVDGRRLNGTGTADDAVGIIHGAGILGSVNQNVGVTQVNQNAGVFNNQLNSMSLGFSWNNAAVVLAESDLGQWNTGGRAIETNTSRVAAMVGSVNNNTGVVMGNQSSAYMGNQANVVSIAAGGLF